MSGHVADMGKMRNARYITAGKPERKRYLMNLGKEGIQ
jgi:hypothetical protein